MIGIGAEKRPFRSTDVVFGQTRHHRDYNMPAYKKQEHELLRNLPEKDTTAIIRHTRAHVHIAVATKWPFIDKQRIL